MAKKDKVLKIKGCLIKVGQPNANGDVYSEDTLKAIVKQMNKGKIPVTSRPILEHNVGNESKLQVIGEITSAEIDEDCNIFVEANIGNVQRDTELITEVLKTAGGKYKLGLSIFFSVLHGNFCSVFIEGIPDKEIK